MCDVTRVWEAIDDGNPTAAEELLPLIYEELRCLAAQKLSHEEPGQTIQATALVHEAYIRLLSTDQRWDGRGHFFAAAAEAMRRILVEAARKKRRQRDRAGQQASDDRWPARCDEPPDSVLAIHDALDHLSLKHPVHAELVKLRFFVGLTIPEAATALGISHATAERYWAYARAWLHQQMSRGEAEH